MDPLDVLALAFLALIVLILALLSSTTADEVYLVYSSSAPDPTGLLLLYKVSIGFDIISLEFGDLPFDSWNFATTGIRFVATLVDLLCGVGTANVAID
ncbi:MAG: hypothetical protein Q9160_007020 [Pyrenula sp. 1 TL-2023]